MLNNEEKVNEEETNTKKKKMIPYWSSYSREKLKDLIEKQEKEICNLNIIINDQVTETECLSTKIEETEKNSILISTLDSLKINRLEKALEENEQVLNTCNSERKSENNAYEITISNLKTEIDSHLNSISSQNRKLIDFENEIKALKSSDNTSKLTEYSKQLEVKLQKYEDNWLIQLIAKYFL